MKIKPILFNTEMVRAILDGRKTVTRRVINLKYSNTHIEWKNDKYGKRLIELQNDVEGETHGKNPDGTTWRRLLAYRELKAPYSKGDILYVRETWRPTKGRMHTVDLKTGKIMQSSEDHHGYEYKAHVVGKGNPYYFPDGFEESKDYEHLTEITFSGKWHPSLHMPKEAARIWLKVKGVSAERLQDIDNVKAIFEGMLNYDGWMTEEYKAAAYAAKMYGHKPPLGMTPKERFAHLWDKTVRKDEIDRYGWAANPWVWVIEFERCEKPEEGSR